MKVLGDNFFKKTIPNVLLLSGGFYNITFQVKIALGTLWISFEFFWLLFILTSGHTAGIGPLEFNKYCQPQIRAVGGSRQHVYRDLQTVQADAAVHSTFRRHREDQPQPSQHGSPMSHLRSQSRRYNRPLRREVKIE